MKDQYERALREAYEVFYDLPWKTDKMFDAMDATAEIIRRNTADVPIEHMMKVGLRFYDLFVNQARTAGQKQAVDALLRLAL